MDESLVKRPVRGILYMSSVPRGMTPSVLKQVLSPFGSILRVYLAPSNSSTRKSTKSRAGLFKEGWIEFEHKKDAKKAVLLNGLPMTHSKKLKDYLWCLKYLCGITWSDLTAQFSYENAVKEQRQTVERSKSRKEIHRYIESSDRHKTNRKIDEKQKSRDKEQDRFEDFKLRFKQRKPI